MLRVVRGVRARAPGRLRPALSSRAGPHTELDALLARVAPLLREHEFAAKPPRHRGTPVVRYEDAEHLRRSVDLSLPDDGAGEGEAAADAVAADVAAALRHGVSTGHPLFLDKLYAGSDATGQVAELAAACLNTNVHTYATAPFFSVVEVETVRRLAALFGYDPDEADGAFVPGGSMANLTAAVVARNTVPATAGARLAGAAGGPAGAPVLAGSVQAHYSLARSAMVLGLGMERGVVEARADLHGRMCARDLDARVREAKARGDVPFFCQATAGSTVMGGFDPLPEVAAVCREHGMWMHVDAAWGGGAAFSRARRHLLRGAELADSIAFNPHKMLGVPLQCSVLLTRRRGELERSNSSASEYLFHDHPDSAYDLGDKTLQCGRKPDAFKLWLGWRRHGLRGFERRVDRAFARAADLVRLVRARPGRFLAVVDDPQGLNVCFWFVPPSARAAVAAGAAPGDPGVFAALDAATPEMYRRMHRRGTALCNFNPLPDHGLPRFFRAVLNGPDIDEADLSALLDEMEEVGADL